MMNKNMQMSSSTRTSLRLQIKKFKRNRCARLFQRAFRNHIYNRLDPITLDKLKTPMFIVNENDHFYFFSSQDLLNYIMSSGDLRNPLTRNTLQIKDIKRLEKITNVKILNKIEQIKEKKKQEDSLRSLDDYYNHVIFEELRLITTYCSSVEHNSIDNYMFCTEHLQGKLFENVYLYCSWIKRTFDDPSKMFELYREMIRYIDDTTNGIFFSDDEALFFVRGRISSMVMYISKQIFTINENTFMASTRTVVTV